MAHEVTDVIQEDLVERLQAIAAIVNSELDLQTTLQTIVDAVAGHTVWELCWLDALDIERGLVEVVARRDKLCWSLRSRKDEWALEGAPAMDAVASGLPIEIVDVGECDLYPEYRDDAREKGYHSGVVLPLSASDPDGRPIVLFVQSRERILPDPLQLAFLRAVASLASVALRNAAHREEIRRSATAAAYASGIQSLLLDALLAGRPTEEALAQLERAANVGIVLLGDDGPLLYAGASPFPDELSDTQWHGVIADSYEAVVAACKESTKFVTLPLAPAGQLTGVPADVFEYYDRADRVATALVFGAAGRRADRADRAALRATIGAVVLAEHVREKCEYGITTDILTAVLTGLLRPAGMFSNDFLERQARAVGLRAESTTALLLIQALCEEIRDSSTTPVARNAMSLVRGCAADWAGALVHGIDQDQLVVFLPGRSDTRDKAVGSAQAWARRNLLPALESRFGQPFVVAVSAAQDGIADFPRAWSECVKAAELAQKLSRRGVVTVEDFGASALLVEAAGGTTVKQQIARVLGPVLEHDETHGGQLFETLDAFLSSGGRYEYTARQLHIHVSTLRYRLDRIRELLRSDMTDDAERFEYSLLIRLHKLRA